MTRQASAVKSSEVVSRLLGGDAVARTTASYQQHVEREHVHHENDQTNPPDNLLKTAKTRTAERVECLTECFDCTDCQFYDYTSDLNELVDVVHSYVTYSVDPDQTDHCFRITKQRSR